MTVYILTSGCYSDYGINAVTLDKDIADKYTKLYPDCEIEEYELLEDRGILNEPVRDYCTCYTDLVGIYGTYYSFENTEWGKDPYNSQKIEKVEIKINRKPPLDTFIEFATAVRQNETREEGMERLKRIVQDTMAQIKSLIEVEGWTMEMVAEKFNGREV